VGQFGDLLPEQASFLAALVAAAQEGGHSTFSVRDALGGVTVSMPESCGAVLKLPYQRGLLDQLAAQQYLTATPGTGMGRDMSSAQLSPRAYDYVEYESLKPLRRRLADFWWEIGRDDKAWSRVAWIAAGVIIGRLPEIVTGLIKLLGPRP